MLCNTVVAPLYPWVGKPAAYDAIALRTGPDGKLMSTALPDDDEYATAPAGGGEAALRRPIPEPYAPAPQATAPQAPAPPPSGRPAADGGAPAAAPAHLARLLVRLSREPGARSRRAVYLALMDEGASDCFEPALQALHKLPGLNAGHLYEEALWLARHGVHRDVVNFALLLLGRFTGERHRELALLLGKHEVFTQSAAAALSGMEQGSLALCELARCVDGWGRIHLVERLDPETQEIRDWLLRDGYRNRIDDALLAYTCALKGELAEALDADAIDPALLQGAGGILAALIAGGPAEDIDDYEQALPAIGDYLRHAQNGGALSPRPEHIAAIRRFLQQDEGQWAERYRSGGWTPELRQAYLDICRRLASDASDE